MGWKYGLAGFGLGSLLAIFLAYPMYINYYNLSNIANALLKLYFYQYIAAIIGVGIWGPLIIPILQAQLIWWFQQTWMLKFMITGSKDAFCINFVILESLSGAVLYAICAETKHKDAADFFAGLTFGALIVIVTLTVIFDALIGSIVL